MKVYILMESDWDYGIPRGVFSSKEKAMEVLPHWKKYSRHGSFQIEEWDIDGPVFSQIWDV